MRILILGAGGMLGQAVVSVGKARGLRVHGASRLELDITATDAVERCLASGFDAVVNCAAFTAVDECESQEQRATEVNGYAVGRLASLCAGRGVALVHVSTDYVFSGDLRAKPYVEEDPVAPQGAYGRSKEVGERLALAEGAMVVRASWLFGPGGPNFVATMLRLAEGGQPVRVVDDQIGCPSYTVDLAEALIGLLQWHASGAGDDAPKLFHFASPPAVSWFGFAQAIFEVFEKPVDLLPCTTESFSRPAPRPAYSVLSTRRLESVLGIKPRSWRIGLADYRLALDTANSVDGDSECAS